MSSVAFEASGKLKPLTAEEFAEADQTSAILCYTDGVTQDGTPYYAYIAVTPSRYAAFQETTLARRSMVLGEYGTIVAAGYEEIPPDDVVEEMRDKYGFDENYTGKVLQRLLEEQKLFFRNQEDKRIMDAVTMLKKKQTLTDSNQG